MKIECKNPELSNLSTCKGIDGIPSGKLGPRQKRDCSLGLAHGLDNVMLTTPIRNVKESRFESQTGQQVSF